MIIDSLDSEVAEIPLTSKTRDLYHVLSVVDDDHCKVNVRWAINTMLKARFQSCLRLYDWTLRLPWIEMRTLVSPVLLQARLDGRKGYPLRSY